MNALAEIVDDTAPIAARPAGVAPAAGASVGAAAERFARLTLAQAPQTQRTYHGCLERFATWLAAHHAERHGHQATPASQAPVEAISADAIALYLQELEQRGLAASTIKKDRAAINRFAKYLHALRAIDATEILMIQGARMHKGSSTRGSLDPETWQRVQQVARARAANGSALAVRDEAIITLLGACGLRNEEVRSLRVNDRFARGRRTWLRVMGKGRREREFPLTAHVTETLRAWDALRPDELAEHPLMFLRLGRPDARGAHARAAAVPPTRADDGRISSEALKKIVAPVMRAAGVGEKLCHPHVLRHTFATLYMQRDGARLEQLQLFMGHASIDTTAQYLHTTTAELEADALSRDCMQDAAFVDTSKQSPGETKPGRAAVHRRAINDTDR